MSARRLVHLGLGAGLLLGLAACQKPSPGVTVVTNGHSVHVAASNYCFHGETLASEDQCPADGPTKTTVKVRPGDNVGIDVDSELADTGWVVYDPVSRQNSDIHRSHYFSFTATFGATESGAFLEIHQIKAGQGPTDLNKVLGIWRFELVSS
ncbi:MAG: hypothetical protein JWO27_3284 [Frankiales bacterium]|jgi:hypothetical protein|nr:hypothetical protein [Frankiales bacterium]MCW2708530.1 hypothetical protein [Frankiales bacterium]